MTAIPSGTKFLGIAASVDTTEKRSKLNNSYQEYYTIGDITGTQTTTVNISSAQILAMGATPVQLLSDPTGLTYYDIDSITIEYTKGSTGYTLLAGNNVAVNYGNTYKRMKSGFIGNDTYATAFIKDLMDNYDTDASYVDYVYNGVTGVYLTTWTGASPTLGDGTLRAIITYTVRTFGA